MQYPAGSLSSSGFLNYGYIGLPQRTQLAPVAKGVTHTAETIVQTSAMPDGYSAGGAWLLPIKAGGMSSWQAQLGITGAGNAIAGGPMDGTAAMTITGAGGLSLTVALGGNGALTITGAGGLALTIGLAGSGALSFTGAAGLSLIVPIDGTGAFGLSGMASMRGNLKLEGSWGGAPALSPEGLAAAVWGSLAAQNNSPGTMGDLLNAAGGGGISGAVIDQIADAVWAWAETVTPGSKGDELAKALRAAKLAAALSA
jgi:hypothetical protein